ncbi:MAG: ATP synthase F1 subunit delta [Candidatus Omnitrophota bacterium]
MNDNICAKRYAEAFLGTCGGHEAKENAVDEIRRVKEILEAHPELRAFLANADIDCAEKCGVLHKVFGPLISTSTLQFLMFLVENDRGREIPGVADCCLSIYGHTEKSEGILKTSIPLDAGAVARITAHLRRKLGRDIELKVEVDGSLGGGIQVFVDNVVIDGSIKRRLEELKDKLLAIKVG